MCQLKNNSIDLSNIQLCPDLLKEYNIIPYCFIPYIVLSTLINDIYTIPNLTIYLNYFPPKYITLFIKLKLKLFKLNMHLSYLVKSSEALLRITSLVSLKKETRCNIICQFVKNKCHFILSVIGTLSVSELSLQS